MTTLKLVFGLRLVVQYIVFRVFFKIFTFTLFLIVIWILKNLQLQVQKSELRVISQFSISSNCEFVSRESEFFHAILTFSLKILKNKLAIAYEVWIARYKLVILRKKVINVRDKLAILIKSDLPILTFLRIATLFLRDILYLANLAFFRIMSLNLAIRFFFLQLWVISHNTDFITCNCEFIWRNSEKNSDNCEV